MRWPVPRVRRESPPAPSGGTAVSWRCLPLSCSASFAVWPVGEPRTPPQPNQNSPYSPAASSAAVVVAAAASHTIHHRETGRHCLGRLPRRRRPSRRELNPRIHYWEPKSSRPWRFAEKRHVADSTIQEYGKKCEILHFPKFFWKKQTLIRKTEYLFDFFKTSAKKNFFQKTEFLSIFQNFVRKTEFFVRFRNFSSKKTKFCEKNWIFCSIFQNFCKKKLFSKNWIFVNFSKFCEKNWIFCSIFRKIKMILPKKWKMLTVRTNSSWKSKFLEAERVFSRMFREKEESVEYKEVKFEDLKKIEKFHVEFSTKTKADRKENGKTNFERKKWKIFEERLRNPSAYGSKGIRGEVAGELMWRSTRSERRRGVLRMLSRLRCHRVASSHHIWPWRGL